MTDKKESSVSIRQAKEKALLLEHLKKVPIIQVAVEKSGVSRATFYRWRASDLNFAKQVDVALGEGVELVSELAESQLISAIKDQNMTAIMFWLRHKNGNYGNKLEISGKIEATVLSDEDKRLIKEALELASYKEDQTLPTNP